MLSEALRRSIRESPTTSTKAALTRRTTTPILGEEEQMADCKEVLHLENVRWAR
jgi:hypothetical protein